MARKLKEMGEGNLCIKYPWPSIARTVYGDHERYKQTIYPPIKVIILLVMGAGEMKMAITE